MGMIDSLFGTVFGNGRNAIAETVEIFRENAEAGAARESQLTETVVSQFGAEFVRAERGIFDRVMDGINRLPRPALAMGTLGLFLAAMVDPVWFSERMQGIALVPEPLWWLLGAIVSFYFGARHQFKGQEFQRSLATTLALAPMVKKTLERDPQPEHDTPGQADTGTDAALSLTVTDAVARENAALADWRASLK